VRRPSLYDILIRTPREAVYANPGIRGTQRSGEGACEVCGSDLPVDSRRSRRFCSEACKKQAKRRRDDPRVGTSRARERRLEHFDARNQMRPYASLAPAGRVKPREWDDPTGNKAAWRVDRGRDRDPGDWPADLDPGSPDLDQHASAEDVLLEDPRGSRIIGIQGQWEDDSRERRSPLYRLALESLRAGVRIFGRELRARGRNDLRAIWAATDDPVAVQRRLDFCAWIDGVHEIGVLEGQLKPVRVYTPQIDAGTAPNPLKETQIVTNAELLERIDAVEETLRTMLLQAAEAAQRLAERHPDRRGEILGTVDALLTDIAAKGR
jgi:hypothetical protein